MKRSREKKKRKFLTIQDLPLDRGPLYIVCFGTSLSGFDWRRLRDLTTVGVNDVIYHVPNLTYHLFNDPGLWGDRYGRFDYWQTDTKLICRGSKAGEAEMTGNINMENVYTWTKVNGLAMHYVTPHSYHLYMSRTVVCPALLLAWKLKANPIYVLGFDCFDRGKGKHRVTYADGMKQGMKKRKHLYRERDGNTIRKKHIVWQKQARMITDHIHSYNKEVKIYNCSQESLFDYWEKKNLETALEEGHAYAAIGTDQEDRNHGNDTRLAGGGENCLTTQSAP